MIKWQ